MVKVTYKPQPGDPETTEWGGRTFKGGEAIDLDGRVAANKSIIERAKGNPWFDVDDGSGASAAKPNDDQKPGEPATPDEYRKYAIDWIGKTTKSRQLERRWNDEEDLREKIGWGSDDQDLIDPILKPRLEKLKQAEDV